MTKAISVVAIVCAIVTLALSIVTFRRAQVTGSKKLRRACWLNGAVAVGWAVTGLWPEVWNWGLPLLLCVTSSLISTIED